jgi:predicted ATP-binding protein involved in virulence
MRIRELTIKNYRAFAEPSPFFFGDRFTVIAGVNGMGKTAILDALALLLSHVLPAISEAPRAFRPLGPSQVHFDAPEAELAVRMDCAGIPIGYILSYDKRRGRAETTPISRPLKEAVRRAYHDSMHVAGAAPLVAYYTPDRARFRLPRKLSTDLPRGQALAYIGALSNRTVNFDDFIGRYWASVVLPNEERQANPNFFGDHVISAMSQILSTFLPGFTNLRVQENPLRLLVDKEGIPLDPTQLSDGERSFLAIVCDLCRRLALANPKLPNPLEGPGVVLIDELELHLHPTWQLEVAEKLRITFPKIQFVVTTHSPFVVQTAREGEVIKLGGELAVEPAGRTLEEVARLVMDVTNTERSPHYQHMLDTARRYLDLVEEAKTASPDRRGDIQQELISILSPFTDNPAYTALLERKGLIERGS